MNNEYAFVIPALNPDEKLIELIINIRKLSLLPIFIIDDGSNQSSKNIFKDIDFLSKNENVYILKHKINLGKGAALKTVFNHILVNYPSIKGVVTLDSDGQHLVKDCIRVLNELKRLDGKTLVLGYREFSKDIPLKSYVGNNISRMIYKLVLKRDFKDTQTGLRGISREFMKDCLTIKANRFEFETEQLVLSTADSSQINIIEVPIETVYIENNKSTSFRPIVDSFKIYFILLRYGFSSVLTALLDFIIFTICIFSGSNIFIANLIARTFATGFQFILLKKVVFYSESGIKSFIVFYGYVILMGIISSWIQFGMTEKLGFTISNSKVLTEILLFFINFSFLRTFIFNKTKRL